MHSVELCMPVPTRPLVMLRPLPQTFDNKN